MRADLPVTDQGGTRATSPPGADGTARADRRLLARRGRRREGEAEAQAEAGEPELLPVVGEKDGDCEQGENLNTAHPSSLPVAQMEAALQAQGSVSNDVLQVVVPRRS